MMKMQFNDVEDDYDEIIINSLPPLPGDPNFDYEAFDRRHMTPEGYENKYGKEKPKEAKDDFDDYDFIDDEDDE